MAPPYSAIYDQVFPPNVKVSSFGAFLIFYERTFIPWRSHGKQHREIEATFNVIVDIAMKLDRKAFERTRYRSRYRRKSVREDGERGRDKIAEGKEKKKKKISYKNGEQRCLLTVSTAIYLEAPTVDITRACIAIDGSENPFWGTVRLMVCFACETLRDKVDDDAWWYVKW